MICTGAEVAVETLRDCGVSHVFGNPGTTELPFIDAVVESDLTYVTCLHEDVAVGAAAGYATRARQLADGGDHPCPLGVANVHTTPGLAHGLGNLHGASFARAPVLLTAGCQTQRHERRDPPLSGDRRGMVGDLVKTAGTVESPDHFPEAVAGAARRALTPPHGPVYLDFSLPVQEATTAATPCDLGAIPRRAPPDERDVSAVARAIQEGSVTMVVGDELGRAGRRAIDRAGRLAERLDAPVYGEPLIGEVAFPAGHPNWVGMLPYEADAIRNRLSDETILFLGCTAPEPFLDYDPPLWNPSSRAVWVGAHEDTVPAEHRFAAVATGALDDAVAALSTTVEPAVAADGSGVGLARPAHRPSSPEGSETEIEAKRTVAAAVANAGQEAVIVDEGVTTGFLLRDRGDLPPGQFIGHSGGGLGYGLPAAIGAAIAEGTHGDRRPIVALIGDGAYQYYPQTIYTAAQQVETPLTVVVPVNGGYGILRDRDVIDEGGTAERPLTFDRAVSVTQNAASYGVRTRHVEDPGATADAIADAMGRGGVEVIAVDVGQPGAS